MSTDDLDLPPQPWKLQPSDDDIEAIKRHRAPPVDDIDGPDGLGYMAEEALHRGSVPRWAPDDQHPDYAHLAAGDGEPPLPDLPSRVTVTPQILELVIAANSFRPEGFGGKIVIALRGARLADKSQYEEVGGFPIEDIRPDHRTFRCTLGFYDRITKLLWAYKASTVPNPKYMSKQINGSGKANMLPTGCYVFRKGAHGLSHKVPISPALRITNPSRLTEDGPATVLRTNDDLTYTWDDDWDDNGGISPNNNVHCAYSDTEFSSAGCLTVCGSQGTLQWGRFQRILKPMPANARVDVLLITGRDLAIAAALLAKPQQGEEELKRLLVRLRTGSTGPAVSRLQERLGTKPTGYFGFSLKKRLVDEQAKRELRTDGVYSARLDSALGWDVMKPEAAAAPLPAAQAEKPAESAPATDPKPSPAITTAPEPAPAPAPAPAPVAAAEPAAAPAGGPVAEPAQSPGTTQEAKHAQVAQAELDPNDPKTWEKSGV